MKGLETPVLDMSSSKTMQTHEKVLPFSGECKGESSFSFEQKHVQMVYDAIAPHFSASRYKEWPRIASFLQTLPPFSLIADAGCGNGKYFACAQYERHDGTVPVGEKKQIRGEDFLSAAPMSKGTTEGSDVSSSSTLPLGDPATSSSSSSSTSSSVSFVQSTSGTKRLRHSVRCSRDGTRGHVRYEKEWLSKVRPTRRFVIGFDRCLPLLERALQPEELASSSESTGHPLITPSLLSSSSSSSVKERAVRPPYSSPSLLPSGKQKNTPVKGTDVLCSSMHPCPFRPGVFDAALCIAVIHHFSSPERRMEAIRQLLRLVKSKGGVVLIYVWALPRGGKPSSSSASQKRWESIDYDTGDALVPWQMNAKFDESQKIFQRYYHFFREGELKALCLEALEKGGITGRIEESYLDKENWCVVIRRT